MDFQQKKIKEKIFEIYASINEHKSENIGLLNGESGVSLFHFYYGLFSQNEEYSKKGIQSIFNSVELINTNLEHYSYCSGLSGFLWSLNHLVTSGFIDQDEVADLQNDFDTFIYKVMLNDIKHENFDFLHGAIGHGIYFIERLKHNKDIELYLNELLDGLENKSIKEIDGSMKWLSVVDHQTGLQAYNLSLSHGVASIIAFLAKLVKHNFNTEKAYSMLQNSLQFLLKNIKDPCLDGYYFPSFIYKDNTHPKQGRLAWCYNDLGIANVLFWVSEIIKDEDLKQKSIEILLYHSNTRNLKMASVFDAGLCHGTAGIAHIYNRMYRNTRIEKFKETHDFWIEETLKMAYHKDGFAGYKTWNDEKLGGWENELGILEGIAGIALALLSSIFDEDLSWDECLLLS